MDKNYTLDVTQDELKLLITLTLAAAKSFLAQHNFGDKKDLELASRIAKLGDKLVSVRYKDSK